MAVLAALGLLLAMLGLFAAISYSVSERKKELGIRVALGAERNQLVRMLLQQTSRAAGVGIGIGILCSLPATILLRSYFYAIAHTFNSAGTARADFESGRELSQDLIP
jgi:ABC-type antimicrobial peptide transport system permease subunit